jgi:iron complex transport system ATP-binding protein
MRIKIQNVQFCFSSKPILKNICLNISSSEIAAICGPNGVGKSTLMKCINRILKPEGSIQLSGQEMKGMSMGHIARKIGYVPQRIANIFSVTVFEMVLMGRRPHLGWKSGDRDKDKVVEILNLMELDKLAMKDFNEISGGQQQKVLIARALAQEPEVLLMDEPTSSLDLRHQLEVMELIRYLTDEQGLSVIMAVHDLNLASRYADKIILMKNGQIYNAGDSKSVLTPENILSIYGVFAVVREEANRPYIVPIGPYREKNNTSKRIQDVA